MKDRFLLSALAIPFALGLSLYAGAQTVPSRAQPTTPKSQTPRSESRVTALSVQKFKLLSAGTGWVSTGDKILMTSDNGTHWKDISPPGSKSDGFDDVFFLDAETGWALSLDPTASDEEYGSSAIQKNPLYLSYTTDGGTTWAKVDLPSREYSAGDMGMGGGIIAFADRMHGWLSMRIMGTMLFHGSILYATSNGGRTWTPTKGGPAGTQALLPVTDKDIWAIGTTEDGNDLEVSRDGGGHFREVDLPPPTEIANYGYPTYTLPVFQNSLLGYEAVIYTDDGHPKSAEVLFATADGGRTWQEDRMLSNLAEWSGNVLPPEAVVGDTWLHAFDPKVSKNPLLRVRKGGVTDVADLDLNSYSCKLSFVTSDEGWRECSGSLFSTTDGGTVWKDIGPRATQPNR